MREAAVFYSVVIRIIKKIQLVCGGVKGAVAFIVHQWEWEGLFLEEGNGSFRFDKCIASIIYLADLDNINQTDQ